VTTDTSLFPDLQTSPHFSFLTRKVSPLIPVMCFCLNKNCDWFFPPRAHAKSVSTSSGHLYVPPKTSSSRTHTSVLRALCQCILKLFRPSPRTFAPIFPQLVPSCYSFCVTECAEFIFPDHPQASVLVLFCLF